MSELLVAPCSHKAAKFAVEHWHYSSSMPTPPVVKFGVWEAGAYVGCVLFSRGANNNLHKAYGVGVTECCELTRVALSQHERPVSQIVSVAVRELRRANPALRVVVSYADPAEGHVGGIYQAMNWFYTGQTSKDFYAIDRAGRRLHSRQVSSTGVKRQYGELRRVPRHDECEIVPVPGKHRYVLPLDKEMRRQLEPLAKPYPKRASGQGDTLAPSQAGGFDSHPDALED